jgi:UDP-glucose 4-epimerase
MKRVFVTGGNGFLGKAVVVALASHPGIAQVVSMDLRPTEPASRLARVIYLEGDVRDAPFATQFSTHAIDTVVHLAAVIPTGRHNPKLEYEIDVLGSQRVLDACIQAKVGKIVVSSSGAAYGYHSDNPAWLSEDAPLRGNDEFPYSRHKRLVEEMLARSRSAHPELKQVVFRVCTILGETVRNPITDLFDQPRILAIKGSDSPFVMIWVDDVVNCIVRAASTELAGIFNVAGDGALSMHEIAAMLGKPVREVPAWLVMARLWFEQRRGRGGGPATVNFLRYRPVLSNARLKSEFGYVPALTSRAVFAKFIALRYGKTVP